jgi:hypothetical protein
MRSNTAILERDAILRATDAITYALLGDAWNIHAHMACKRHLLDIIDSSHDRIIRTLDDGTPFLGDR